LKARDLLNESLNIYNDYYEQNHVTIGWVFFHFGNVYLRLNDPDKSQKMLKQALTIYETIYGEYHIQTAGVLNSLGEVSMLNGDIEKAEHLFSKSLNIFRQNKHPESYNALENLSNLYLSKSKQEMNKGNIDNASDLKAQSVNYLKQALEILTTYCPKDSLHIRRIRFKLKTLNV
jgi:tetratricopeptide (TPR) repeat protein